MQGDAETRPRIVDLRKGAPSALMPGKGVRSIRCTRCDLRVDLVSVDGAGWCEQCAGAEALVPMLSLGVVRQWGRWPARVLAGRG
jgi:hypothetical protein